MMQNWYDPSGPRERFQRSFSVLNLAIIVFTLVLLASEFRFDWCETLAGRFLMSVNENRPEIGGIWDSGRHLVNARQSINQMILRKETARENVRKSDSFEALAKDLGPGEWVNLDKVRFKQLYLSLAREMRMFLIEPARLVWLLNGNATDRIFCEGQPFGLKVYFIDSNNRVIDQVDLDTRKMAALSGQAFFQGTLDALPGFSGRIYDAAPFFKAVFKLPPNMMPDLIQNGDSLFAQSGMLTRVGVWNTSEHGFIRLGFEFIYMGETRVVQIKAREWAVWQLSLILKGEGV
ncbi:MAG: hypothetical protein HUN05_07750 [Desulfobacter sp.]|nr:MAG: hypothetical protein HUN05_07750 [Desulfobacter sp.]